MKPSEATTRRTSRKRLWIFDFDGTLSPHVPNRDDAVIDPACMKLLQDLKNEPYNRVAVLSSRSLDDLCSRVRVSGVFLGGGSGTEWRTPEACRLTLSGEGERRLNRSRKNLLEPLQRISMLPGIELEDKKWSIAIHTRNATSVRKIQLLSRLELLRRSHDLSWFLGHEVVEVQFLPEINKAFGVRFLCRVLKVDPAKGRIFYAGDDENDAVAMRWIAGIGGTVVTVGNTPLVPDSAMVCDQVSLAREVRRLARLDATVPGKPAESPGHPALKPANTP